MKNIKGRVIKRIAKIWKWFFVITGSWLIVLAPALIYDFAHCGRLPHGKLLEWMKSAESFLSGLGFDYCRASNILSDGFATLFTAMSLVFTMCTSLMHRSVDQIYGISRSRLVFNGKEHLYKYCNRVVYGAPIFMALTVNLGYAMAGFEILLIVYGYLLLCYGIYGWTFEEKANEERMVRYLGAIFPKNLEDMEKLSVYRKTLGGIGVSARNDDNWQGIKELVYRLLQEAKGLDEERRFIQVYAMHSDIFQASASNVLLEVVLSGLRLLRKQCLCDIDFDAESCQISVWAMLCGSFPKFSDAEVVQLLEGLLDFKGRIAELGMEDSSELSESQLGNMKIETGMALILLECRLNNENNVSEGLRMLLPQVWSHGRFIFAGSNRILLDKMTKYYKKWSVLPDIQWDIYLNNLQRDYEKNSTYSVICSLKD